MNPSEVVSAWASKLVFDVPSAPPPDPIGEVVTVTASEPPPPSIVAVDNKEVRDWILEQAGVLPTDLENLAEKIQRMVGAQLLFQSSTSAEEATAAAEVCRRGAHEMLDVLRGIPTVDESRVRDLQQLAQTALQRLSMRWIREPHSQRV